jgi:hypothetical protein
MDKRPIPKRPASSFGNAVALTISKLEHTVGEFSPLQLRFE